MLRLDAAGRDGRAAIDDNRLAIDIASGRRGEEHRCACDLYRYADPPERNALKRVGQVCFIFPEGPSEVGLDQAGGDAIYADVLWPELYRQVPGQLEIGSFGQVVSADHQRAAEAPNRGHDDDSS